ncbi:lipase family alpha/beta hydrolase [Herbiconiux sp. SYSU D00978]|uniref:lipase family alpha/beta hydrolase n=1 Tax=Herbiconiux sp. SYSU D00978 TaxID=2812562 RepID=UPI001A97C5B6|nr:alpha/beta fold hydrolase [Herbiconiux sp. SYSU D00978]
MRRTRTIASLLAAAACLATGLVASPAAADTTDIAPPGANDWNCSPTAEHPNPIVLVPGTFESMLKNWAVMSPALKDAGYCVFSLNYGVTNGVPATGPIEDSAAELASFVDAVLAATGAKKVDLVGHSQGGMMPRYYLKFLGGTKKVDTLIGIAPSNHGTDLSDTSFLGLYDPLDPGLPASSSGTAPSPGAALELCTACDQQAAGSAFLQNLNAGGDLVGKVKYTVIMTRYDEIVRPYQTQALAGPSDRVTNVVVQDLCRLDVFEHDQLPNDPNVLQLVLADLADEGRPLDPAYRPACL